MSKPTKKSGKAELVKQEKKDPITYAMQIPDEQVQVGDMVSFINALKERNPQFSKNIGTLKDSYENCFDMEISLHEKINVAKQHNDEVKKSRSDVADKLHPVIIEVNEALGDQRSIRKISMTCAVLMRYPEGKKEAEQKGFTINNMNAILKIYASKYGDLIPKKEGGSTSHSGANARTYNIDIDDTDIIDEFIREYTQTRTEGTFSKLRLIIDEHFDLQKIQVMTAEINQ